MQVKPVMLDRKTQLENQILGKFERLEDDLVLASSVRGGGTGGGAGGGRALSPLEREAADAVMTRAFIKDEVRELKAQKAAGEGKDGRLVLLKPPGDAAAAARAERLVAMENKAREVIVGRVVQSSGDLGERDLPLVWGVLYRLNVRTAAKGDMLQRPDGTWVEQGQ